MTETKQQIQKEIRKNYTNEDNYKLYSSYVLCLVSHI